MLYAHVFKVLPIDRSAYEQTLTDWEIEPIEIGGVFCGVSMLRDHEIHVCLDEEMRMAKSRALVKKVFVSNLEKLGFLETIALKSDLPSQAFIERLGFQEVREDESFKYYRISQTKFR